MEEQIKLCLEQAKSENKNNQKKFMTDCRKAEIDVRYYRGRNFYYGLAASCKSIQDVLSITTVPCTYDQLGKGYIVYPKVGLSGDVLRKPAVSD